MSLDEATRERITQLISSHEVVLFMKGDRSQPQCGFSATVVQILDSVLPDYATLDVLSNPDIRDGIKIFSSWPTIPQLYVKGEFVGGCDIVKELAESGELYETLGVKPEPVAIPTIRITEAAAEALHEAMARHGGPGRFLHLQVDGRFQASLSMAPRGPLDVEAEASGICVLLDPMSARRAEGLSIDVVPTPNGPGFKIDNPNAPQVGQMTVQELKRALDAGEKLELLDVRTPEERARASIVGSVLMSEPEARRLEGLPKDTCIVFHCGRGPRSQAAAEHFAALGFTRVFNLQGGIEAWLSEIEG